MFGYVRPNRDELKVRQLRDYEALYCGLCSSLGKRHGFFARFFLNYDFTFLAMLLDGGRPETERRRCPARRTASSPSRNAQASQLRPAKNVYGPM